MIAIIVGILVGIGVGYFMPIYFSPEYGIYFTVIVLVAIDAILGAIYAHYNGKFDNYIFIVGLSVNLILSVFLSFVGEKLGIPLYYAPIFVFGTRLFEKTKKIRDYFIKR